MNTKKNIFSKLLLLILIAFIFSNCDTRGVYEKNNLIPNNIWNQDNRISFEIDVKDTVSLHDFYINIRNAGNYQFSNIFMFVNTTFPSGKSAKDTVECMLADAHGKWLGDGLGDIWDARIMFKRNVRFSQSGTYTFEYEQAMRVEKLPGIMDMGLRIEKP